MNITLITNLNGGLVALSYGSETDITIGREIGNTIAPLAAEGLSRRHARIFLKDGKWFVEDLGSTNGSFRLGTKIEGAVELQVRDMLQFGKFEVSVESFGTSAADEPVPAPVAAVPPVTPAPAPAPVAPAPAPAPVAPAPVAPAPIAPAPVAPAAPAGIRRPTLPGLKPVAKPGLNLPPKPTLAPGLKLPPRPVIGGAKPVAPKPVLPKPAAPVTPLQPLEPLVELTPVEPLQPIS